VDADVTLPVPPEYTVLVVRTDFTDDAAFDAVCDLIALSVCEGNTVDQVHVEDRRLADADPDSIYRRCLDTGIRYLFIADARTMSDPDHPLLVLDVDYDEDRPGRTFRMVPAEVAGFDVNLGISNLDFHEFAERVDPDGVFRGFR
jgi:hypothetical protein